MASAKAAAAEAQFERWRRDPVAFVLDVFGPGYLERHEKPLVLEEWQEEALRALVEQPLRRYAYAASKGVAKTCTLAFAGWWILACHRDAQGIATSVTGDQLSAGLWKEMATWYALAPVLQRMFTVSAQAIRARPEKRYPKLDRTWFLEARSWPKGADKTEQTAAFKGLHGPAPFFLGDEAGNFDDGPVEAADGIFANADADSEPYLAIAGNTERQAGPLYRAVLNRDSLWWVKRISGDPDDPKRCKRVSIQWAKDQLAQCGGDTNHPIYKVNVKGEFPDVAFDKLLGPDQVDAAIRRIVRMEQFHHDPIIVGIDTADGGADSTALIVRWGCIAFRPITWRTGDPMVLADQIAAVLSDLGRVAKALRGRKADTIFVDLGGPSGHGVQSRLKQLGFPAIGVDFGSPPVWSDATAPVFRNRRAEMGWRCSQWVKSIGSLPDDQLLRGELLEPIFFQSLTGPSVYQFEKKEAVKARLNRSPDRADALWLTFAAPVVRRLQETGEIAAQTQGERKFDPFKSMGGR